MDRGDDIDQVVLVTFLNRVGLASCTADRGPGCPAVSRALQLIAESVIGIAADSRGEDLALLGNTADADTRNSVQGYEASGAGRGGLAGVAVTIDCGDNDADALAFVSLLHRIGGIVCPDVGDGARGCECRIGRF